MDSKKAERIDHLLQQFGVTKQHLAHLFQDMHHNLPFHAFYPQPHLLIGIIYLDCVGREMVKEDIFCL